MKKLLLIGLVVLVALVCLPAVVSAAESDTVVVSGSVSSIIDVSVTPDSFPMVPSGEYMIVGENHQSGTSTQPTDVYVTTSLPTWRLTISSDGNMKTADNTAVLNQPFRWKYSATDASEAYKDLTSAGAVFYDGTGTTPSHHFPGFMQEVLGTDPAGAYSITITFTGSAR